MIVKPPKTRDLLSVIVRSLRWLLVIISQKNITTEVSIRCFFLHCGSILVIFKLTILKSPPSIFCECVCALVCSHLPVKGVYIWCPGCAHGGHVEHITTWFDQQHLCPAGCGHYCEFAWKLHATYSAAMHVNYCVNEKDCYYKVVFYSGTRQGTLTSTR